MCVVWRRLELLLHVNSEKLSPEPVASTKIFGIHVLVSDNDVISNLVMSIVEKEPSGFRITVKQPITTCAGIDLVSHL